MASAEQQFRLEKDSMGEVKVPQASLLWGANAAGDR